MKKNKILLSPGELVLKGKNRRLFERQLDANLRQVLGNDLKDLRHFRGRRLLAVAGPAAGGKIKYVFGVSRWAWVEKAATWPELEKKLLAELTGQPRQSFAVRVSDKTKKASGQQLNTRLGAALQQGLGWPVDLDQPQITVYVDRYLDGYYFHFGWQKGSGGMPVGTSGRVLVLFSGGIDSPVAAYLLARRGCQVDLLHFYALENPAAVLASKIGKLFQLLQPYLLRPRLILLPYHRFYRAIRQRPATGNETVLFRRFILRAGELLAEEYGYQALVTGDNLAQVASQTLTNLAVTSQAVKIPIFRPLIGFDKIEIIAWARKIGSYSLSLEDYLDCCALIQKHPRTRVNLQEIENEEQNLRLASVLLQTVKERRVIEGK